MRILILGGSTEASVLARTLAGDPRFLPILSLAGRTAAPVLPPVAVRIGGFGGVAGLAEWLRAERIAAVVNATHPFAARISDNAVAAAGITATPLLRVLRPAWTPTAGDAWQEVPDMAAAARALGPVPRRVLLTVGRQDLAPFAAAPQHFYLVRSVDPPPAETLPPRAQVIAARGPFAEAAERTLLRDHAIGVLVTKNAGGSATRGKLDAARAGGVKVVMVARPPPAAGATVADTAGAMEWLDHLHGAWRGV